eukprot:Lankesteria_metandrocarpae@DN4514_c0_g1_i1.p1
MVGVYTRVVIIAVLVTVCSGILVTVHLIYQRRSTVLTYDSFSHFMQGGPMECPVQWYSAYAQLQENMFAGGSPAKFVLNNLHFEKSEFASALNAILVSAAMGRLTGLQYRNQWDKDLLQSECFTPTYIKWNVHDVQNSEIDVTPAGRCIDLPSVITKALEEYLPPNMASYHTAPYEDNSSQNFTIPLVDGAIRVLSPLPFLRRGKQTFSEDLVELCGSDPLGIHIATSGVPSTTSTLDMLSNAAHRPGIEENSIDTTLRKSLIDIDPQQLSICTWRALFNKLAPPLRSLYTARLRSVVKIALRYLQNDDRRGVQQVPSAKVQHGVSPVCLGMSLSECVWNSERLSRGALWWRSLVGWFWSKPAYKLFIGVHVDTPDTERRSNRLPLHNFRLAVDCAKQLQRSLAEELNSSSLRSNHSSYSIPNALLIVFSDNLEFIRLLQTMRVSGRTRLYYDYTTQDLLDVQQDTPPTAPWGHAVRSISLSGIVTPPYRIDDSEDIALSDSVNVTSSSDRSFIRSLVEGMTMGSMDAVVYRDHGDVYDPTGLVAIWSGGLLKSRVGVYDGEESDGNDRSCRLGYTW